MDEELLKKLFELKKAKESYSDEDLVSDYKKHDVPTRREKSANSALDLTPDERMKIGDNRFLEQKSSDDLLKDRGYNRKTVNKAPFFKNKATGKVLKSLPYIGSLLGVASAIHSGDASAAIPILNEVEGLGPEQGSDDYLIENPSKDRMLKLKTLLQNRKK